MNKTMLALTVLGVTAFLYHRKKSKPVLIVDSLKTAIPQVVGIEDQQTKIIIDPRKRI